MAIFVFLPTPFNKLMYYQWRINQQSKMTEQEEAKWGYIMRIE